MQRVLLNDSRTGRLTVALLAALAALLLRQIFEPLAGPAALWLTFTAGITLGAWYGGLKPGLVSTLFLTVAAAYLNESGHPPGADPNPGRWATGIFAIMAFAVCVAMQRLRMERFRSLHTQRQLLEALESTEDIVISVDQDLRCTYANARAGKLARKPPSQVVGRSLRTIFPETPETTVYRELNHLLLERAPARFQSRVDATKRWYEFEAHPALHGSKAGGINLFIRDITDRRNAETERRNKQRDRENLYTRLGHVAREVPVGVIVVTREFQVDLANAAACEIFAVIMEPGALLLARQTGVMHTADGSELLPDQWPLRCTILTGTLLVNLEVDYQREDGVQLTLIVNSLPLTNSDGTLRGAVATYSNITSIRELQRTLRASDAGT